MKLAIDASTMIEGGGLKYLSKLIDNYLKKDHSVEKLLIFVSNNFNYKKYDGLENIEFIELPKKFLFGFNVVLWKLIYMKSKILKDNYNILFSLSGYNLSFFYPFVSIIHNQLPFEIEEIKRYGISLQSLKFLTLRILLDLSIKKASGVIFLSNFSKNKIISFSPQKINHTVIPHGLDQSDERIYFPKESYQGFNQKNPFKICYISNFEPYKHQDKVGEAIKSLRHSGLHIEINFIGKVVKSGRYMESKLKKIDPNSEFINILGWKPAYETKKILQNSDLAIFASTCETFGQIVLEIMRWGVPLICSKDGPMKEILEKCSVGYFNPLDPEDLQNEISKIYYDNVRRNRNSNEMFERSLEYTWEKSFQKTFKFIHENYLKSK